MSETFLRLSSLAVLGGPMHGRAVIIEDAFDEITIGSDPGCRLCVDAPGVSPIHATVRIERGEAWIADAHSGTGVYVNLERVAEATAVGENDIIYLGTPTEPGAVMIQPEFEEAEAAPLSIAPSLGPDPSPEPSVEGPREAPIPLAAYTEGEFELEQGGAAALMQPLEASSGFSSNLAEGSAEFDLEEGVAVIPFAPIDQVETARGRAPVEEGEVFEGTAFGAAVEGEVQPDEDASVSTGAPVVVAAEAEFEIEEQAGSPFAPDVVVESGAPPAEPTDIEGFESSATGAAAIAAAPAGAEASAPVAGFTRGAGKPELAAEAGGAVSQGVTESTEDGESLSDEPVGVLDEEAVPAWRLAGEAQRVFEEPSFSTGRDETPGVLGTAPEGPRESLTPVPEQVDDFFFDEAADAFSGASAAAVAPPIPTPRLGRPQPFEPVAPATLPDQEDAFYFQEDLPPAPAISSPHPAVPEEPAPSVDAGGFSLDVLPAVPAAEPPPTFAPPPWPTPSDPAQADDFFFDEGLPVVTPPASIGPAPAEVRPRMPSPLPPGGVAPTAPAPIAPALTTDPALRATREASAPRADRSAPVRPDATLAPRPERTTPPRGDRTMAPGRSLVGRKPVQKRSSVPLYVGVVAAALALVGVGGYFTLSFLGGPKLVSLSPTKARVGEVLTLHGSGFAPEASGNEVLFGDRAVTAHAVSPSSLEVRVPDPSLRTSPEGPVQVRVRVGERETVSLGLEVYLGPTVHGISPDVAMQGEDITLAGVGFGLSPTVSFGGMDAEILEARDTTLRVRVPAVEGGPGTAAPVVVTSSGAASNEGPFFIGRLPLLLPLDPTPVNLGDVVTLRGKGFRRERVQNHVTVNGVRALVVSAADSEIRFAVPRVKAAEAPAVVEVVVPGGQEPGQVTLNLVPQGPLVAPRFIPEPFDAAPGRDHAVIATGLGPAFVLASSQGRSAAERAADFAKRLTVAVAALESRPAENLELRGLEGIPVIGLPGTSEAVLEITPEDVAAYDEDWTGLKGRGGPVTALRLGRWWEAVARDLVLVLGRRQAPRFAAALAPEGRVLGDVFKAATRAREVGITLAQVSSARPAQISALRLLGLRVPSAVVAPVSGAALGQDSMATPVPARPAPLNLTGVWIGSEIEDGMKRYITLNLRGRGGDLVFEGAVSVTVPLQAIEQAQKETVRFMVVFRGGERYYFGKWDGEAVTGKVASDQAGARPLGSFEIRPR